MRRGGFGVLVALVGWVGLLLPPAAEACTNFLITKEASADGSVMITYSCDAHDFYGELAYIPPEVHPPGAKRDVSEWDTGKYLDGNVKTPGREVEHPGYGEGWYRHLVEQEGDRLKVRPLPGEPADGH